MIRRIKRIHLFVILLIIIIMNMFVLKVDAAADLTKKDPTLMSPSISLEYLEDNEGNLTFNQIKSELFRNSFKPLKDSSIGIGHSKSNWWFRIKVKDLQDFSTNKYFSINNAYAEKVILYLPQTINGQETYSTMKSGGEFKNDVDDIGFIYPVFEIPQNTNPDKYIYIETHSVYTQNYEFKILNHQELDDLRQLSLLCIGIFFGILIAMVLYNFILFMFLRDKVYLYYVIYIFTMTLYQLGLTGTIKIFKWKLAYLVEQHFGIIGLFASVAAIVFVRGFLKIEENAPWHDKFLEIASTFIIIDIFLMLLGYKYIALVTSLSITNVVLLVILSASVCCLYRKVRQSRYFIVAWGVMITGSMICILRALGLFSQNFITMNCMLGAAAIESILISVALADRIKILRKEKEEAWLLFENAERTSRFHEIAFLKAQIKPHFLYNALNVIAALCLIEPKKAKELILDLSNYLHYTFTVNGNAEYICFEEELEFIEAYTRIQKARFRDKLKVKYEIEDTSELMIPPLILQPLVENAIRHGIRKKEQGGSVIIRVENKKDCFVISVEDDGIGIIKEELEKIENANFEKGKGIGIVNIKLRLKELYGTDLVIKSEYGQGTLLSFNIPKRGSI